MSIPPAYSAPHAPMLLEVVRERIRAKHYSRRTEQSYTRWIRRFVNFYHKKHPRDMGAPEVEAFLTDLAVNGRVSAATQTQALSALLFLYKEVLGIDVPWMGGMVRAKASIRIPIVLSVNEVHRLLACLDGVYALMARLIYGSGMRLMECVTLRVKDVDFDRLEVVVRQGKGRKDRVMMLPESLVPELQVHLKKVRVLFDMDRKNDVPGVEMPDALAKKYPNAGKEWGWFWVFPASGLSDLGSVVSCCHQRIKHSFVLPGMGYGVCALACLLTVLPAYPGRIKRIENIASSLFIRYIVAFNR